MLRITKMADYGALVMAYLASQPELALNAKEIADKTRLAVPTVTKLLKLLTRSGLLISVRGSQGGYRLARSAKEISIIHIIDALDGNTALTECSQERGLCSLESSCALQDNWKLITKTIRGALQSISLSDLVQQKMVTLTIQRPL